jgi:hypothetical protein
MRIIKEYIQTSGEGSQGAVSWHVNQDSQRRCLLFPSIFFPRVD